MVKWQVRVSAPSMPYPLEPSALPVIPLLESHRQGRESLYCPQQCVCCGGIPDDQFEVSWSGSSKEFSETGTPVISVRISWNLPYCKICRQHYKRYSEARVFFWVLLSIFGFIALGSLSQMNWVALAFSTVCLGVVIVIGRILEAKARKIMKESCSTVGKPAKYTGSKLLQGRTFHTFYFKSRTYGEAFARANGVTPEFLVSD